MNQLAVIEHKNERVLTTQQLADAYETNIGAITDNFNNNKKHYIEGKHYFRLTGEDLKAFLQTENFRTQNNSKTRVLYVWTEKGAAMHAKSLNTDKAWELYEHLVETYFRVRDLFKVPQTLPEALRMAADLAEKIEQDKPKVLFADKCFKSGDSILIRELAKIACERGFEIGEHRLYKKLREWGMLNRDNEPYQKYIHAGYFERSQSYHDTPYGVRLAQTTRVLPKGQAYILNRLAAG